MTHRNKRSMLLASACVGLLMAATPAKAVDLGWDAFFEGRFLFGFGDRPLGGIEADASVPSYGPLFSDQGEGPGGAVGIGYRFRDGWRAGASITFNRIEGVGSDGIADLNPIFPVVIAQDLSQETENFLLDFEVGKDFGIGEGGVITAFGGLRIGWIDRNASNELDITLGIPAPPIPVITLQRDDDFFGMGPRVGMRASYPLGDGFAIEGGASASLLYGRQESSIGVAVLGYSYDIFSTDENRLSMGLDGELGVSYLLDETFKITMGYRVDAQFSALNNQLLPEGALGGSLPGFLYGEEKANMLSHGAFLRGSFSF